MSPKSQIQHIGIIMDGNGRWAESQDQKRIFGHEKGAQVAKAISIHCAKLKIPYLSLFTLSTENTLRHASEISFLMNLLERLLEHESSFLEKENIKIHTLGDLSFFSDKIQDLLIQLKKQTSEHTGLNLILNLNYGGRSEILTGIKNFLKTSSSAETLTEKEFAKHLPSSEFPELDLIVRSGGQTRLSNFYLWSSAYSELYFTDVLWPDFTTKDLDLALEKFHQTKRKYGRL